MFPTKLSGYMIPGKIMGKNESPIVRSRYTVDSEPRLSSCFTEGQSNEKDCYMDCSIIHQERL